MPQRHIRDIKSVQRNVLRYSLAGAVLIAALTALFVMVPMHNQLRDASVTHLGQIADSKADAIVQILNRAQSVAAQISSRLRARQMLEELAAGTLDQRRFQLGTRQAFDAAMESSDEIVGITRVDAGGTAVVTTGADLPRAAWPAGWKDSPDPLYAGPVPLHGAHYLAVSSPIIARDGRRIGTDIVTFSTKRLLHLFAGQSAMGRTGRAFLVFGPPDERKIMSMSDGSILPDAAAVASPKTFDAIIAAAGRLESEFTLDERHTFAQSPVGRDWILILRRDADEVFGELNKNLTYAAAGVLGLVLLGMSGLFLFLNPLTSRVEKLSGAMETQFYLALDNIPNGLCMFDENLRIVAFNRRYQDIYGFDEGFLQPGVSRSEAFWHLVNKGALKPLENPRDTIKAREAQLRRGRNSTEQILADGRVIEVRFGDWTDGYIVAVYTDITERKKVERTLTDRRAELQAVIDAVPALINVKDADGRYVMSNRYHMECLGLTEQDIQGRTSEIVGSEHASIVSALDRQVIETGAAIPFFDFEIRDKHGDIRQVICTKVPLKDAEGRAVGVITTTIDVTERRLAEKRLAESEARFRQILEESPIAITITDLSTGERLFANPRLAAMLGAASLDEAFRHDVSRTFVDPAELDAARAMFERDGRVDHFEAERFHLDGKTRWWSMSSWRPIRFEGRDAQIVWTLDITKRKEAEQQIALQSAILRVTLDSMPSGLCVFDEDMKYVTFNHRFSLVSGQKANRFNCLVIFGWSHLFSSPASA